MLKMIKPEIALIEKHCIESLDVLSDMKTSFWIEVKKENEKNRIVFRKDKISTYIFHNLDK